MRRNILILYIFSCLMFIPSASYSMRLDFNVTHLGEGAGPSANSTSDFARPTFSSLSAYVYPDYFPTHYPAVFSNFEDISSNSLDIAFEDVAAQTKTPHILVIGGIQGDEPGSFSAASLLATRYTVTKGAITVVPNLNFYSIIRRNRGIYGDMNRKFAQLDLNDPEYAIVRRIQEMIVSQDIDLVLNLHDGSGFYNPKYISPLQNPNRWGNCVIIDQTHFDAPLFGNLEEIASEITKRVNENLLENLHALHVHNTKTGEGNEQMAKSLTWFALKNGKPAFGLEASKNLSVAKRTYYHLSMIENFMDIVGIEFKRPFALGPEEIQKELYTNIYISFSDGRLILPLSDVRSQQSGRIPMSKEHLKSSSNSPILTGILEKTMMQVHYGNNNLTKFYVDWHELDTSIDGMNLLIDGIEQEVSFGSQIFAKESILVKSKDGYRVNAIGATLGASLLADESDKIITKKDFQSRFSVDKSGNTYRVEVYCGKKYTGTFIVQFAKNNKSNVIKPECF